MAILELNDLITMMVAIIGKLRENDLELGRLKDEEVDKKNNELALKISTSHHEASDEDPSVNLVDANMNLLVKKFSKFMKKKGKDKGNFQKKSTKKSDFITPKSYTCFECRKQGHIKGDSPTCLKKQQGGDTKQNIYSLG